MKPKSYKYVDIVTQGNGCVMGFIAQQVKTVLEYAVSYSTNFIPNIYELAKINNGNQIMLINKNTKDLSFNISSDVRIKLIDNNNCEIIVTFDKILDEKNFAIKENICLDSDTVFVYGIEVNDFNNLNTDTIFTITTSALQEVDKELQDTKNKVEKHEKTIMSLERQIEILQKNVDIMMKRLG
jgi:hypothetical protein